MTSPRSWLRPLLLAVSAAAAMASAHAATPTLVVSTYGLNQDLLRRELYAPFEAQCGCKVVIEAGNAADRLAKLDARKNNQTIDLIQLTDYDAYDASQRGLLQTLDYDRLPNEKQLQDFARDPLHNRQAIGNTVISVGLVVRSDKPAAASITSWRDLWRPELKDRLLLPNISTTSGNYLLLMADRAWDGQGEAMSTAFSKLSEIKGNAITFYTQTAQMSSLFAQDEAWAAPVGRFAWLNLQKTGVPLKWVVPKEGMAGAVNVLAIPKGSKHADLAYKLIDFWLSKERQSALANALVDSPVNSQAEVQADKAPYLTYGADMLKSLVFMDPATYLRQRQNWIDSWNRQVAR